LTGRLHGPDHKSAGAVHAKTAFGKASLPLQFVIAGHHGGLPDKADLDARLAGAAERYQAVIPHLPGGLRSALSAPTLPSFLMAPTARQRNRRLEMFTRMLYSALVDADYLDTEAFVASVDPERSGGSVERDNWHALSAYVPVLDARLARLQVEAHDTPVNVERRRVLEWCRRAADSPRGAYTLTVPTGGGKTLSALAFALHHAKHHDLRRVIIALPFTSIIDQTVAVLRDVFVPALGPNILVEHHSAIDPPHDTRANQLASENWDAPLIVTTQVQLFESLFANRSSRCRKLHNLANAVLILDEVQTLPCGLLAPILDQLQDLKSNYGVTLLLTTATQPSLHSRLLGARPFAGLEPQPTEIVPADAMDGLFGALRRVKVHWPEGEGALEWADLAQAINEHEQVLAIVHRRADAKTLWQMVEEGRRPNLYHLSALMCPAHRRDVLERIRQALHDGRPCRVISTQLVEAGVDVDFPVVYRAMAGLESLAQAAGRCNREGQLPHGEFRVFNAPTAPPGELRHHADIAQVMRRLNSDLDLMAPDTFRGYFDRLYSQKPTDALGVQRLRESLLFRTTADTFKMIEDSSATVFVPYEQEGSKAVAALRKAGPSRARFRALQPFGVSVYRTDLEKLTSAGAVELLHESVYVLIDTTRYDKDCGLNTEGGPLPALIQ
jgi:CRISPR-associated endonuclease/helicase Cas3